jgi:arginase
LAVSVSLETSSRTSPVAATNGSSRLHQVFSGDANHSANRLRNGPVQPILVPLWYGCERPGVDQAPALLDAALRHRWREREDIELASRLQESVTVEIPDVPGALERRDRHDLAFLPAIAVASARLADEAERAVASGALALTIGGDHAVAAGSLAGSARAVRRLTGPDGQLGRLGVIWVDTHADLNTPATSPSGHIHGLPLATSLGIGPEELTSLAGGPPAVAAADVCLVGVRDLDPGEQAVIREHGIWTRTMEEWDDDGIREGVLAAIAHLRERGVAAVHLSFDVDVIDPVDLPATGTICPGGLTSREAARVLRLIRDADLPLVSADVVELDPTRDHDDLYLWTTTILIATLLGETQR